MSTEALREASRHQFLGRRNELSAQLEMDCRKGQNGFGGRLRHELDAIRQAQTFIGIGIRACPQLEDSQADYRVIYRRSADSELTDAPLRPSGRPMGQDQGYIART